MERYDVAVIGGGTAGVIAAVQSAREGAKTLLVEKNEILGGTMVAGGVAYPGLFFAWKKQIIAGIGWELVVKAARDGGNPLPDPSTQERQRHYLHQVRLNGAVWALICDEAVHDAGVHVLLDTMIAGVKENYTEKQITLCTKEGLKEVSATVLIDCTGDANAVALAGYRTIRSTVRQPATYYSLLDGYDLADVEMETLGKAYDEAVARGELSYSDISWATDGFHPNVLRSRAGTASHVIVDPATATETSQGRTELAMSGRASLLRLLRFFRRQKGLEHFTVRTLAPECGVRETVRIIGKETVTAQDYLAGRRYGDDICYTFYPIDLHTSTGGGLAKTYLEEGIVPSIPLRALIPAGSENLLAAGRCVSSDQEANSAIRVQSTCMAEGQAAGALAALAVRSGVPISQVPYTALCETLRRNGAIVPDDEHTESN